MLMKAARITLLALVLASLGAGLAAAQGTDGRDPAFEQAIYNRLAAISPEAADL